MRPIRRTGRRIRFRPRVLIGGGTILRTRTFKTGGIDQHALACPANTN